ncbi:MAG: haloacid dehalogenase-like hydrolase [Acidobacteriaceae bacterium]|jgi:phosphoglycolate phosphatase-like HAD superfamily hydrolase|nr:haloacid dehalogenase-like hydrolase [Acidobacteriaceae bacterium]
MKIVLFDIDGTLVLTGGAGARAMARAAVDLFGVENADQSIAMAGRTDSWIVAQMAALVEAPCDPQVIGRFRAVYVRYLLEEIAHPGPKKYLLPGVAEIVALLHQRDDVHLGLLTGNFHEGARIKLEHFGIWPFFHGGAFGDDAEQRPHLFEIALARIANAGGPVVPPGDVVIVGDTPLDVEVARVAGARSLAVATGPYDVRALRESGASVVMEDLRDREAVLGAIGLTSGPE